MTVNCLRRETWVPRPLRAVFDFFACAENLAEITPPWLQFKILSPLPIEMSEGTTISYSLRIHGLRCFWLTRIERWEPPLRFVDTQQKGPYRLWRHTHNFAE